MGNVHYITHNVCEQNIGFLFSLFVQFTTKET